jgi:hypothetical protein
MIEQESHLKKILNRKNKKIKNKKLINTQKGDSKMVNLNLNKRRS